MTKSFVYWLYNSTCGLIEETGYVGITKDPVNRKKQHLASKRVPSDSVMSILFEGTREECENKETELRPDFNIGWNLARGGRRGRVGGTHSDDTRGKISKANKGVPKSKEHLEKMRQASTGRVHSQETRDKIRKAATGIAQSDETRAKMSKASKGKRKSKEHCANISKGQIGRKHSEETIEKMRKAHTREALSKETLDKMSAAKKGKKHTKETRDKMSETHLRNHAEARA